jgi:CBS domain-containing protein
MLAKDVMTTAVLTALPGTDVREIAGMLLERRISAVPIVDERGKLRGIVSEGDLINRPESGTQHRQSWWLRLVSAPEEQARDYLRAHGTRAQDVMTEDVITVAEDTPLSKIAALLEKHRIKRVPVVRDGKLVGIVSRANLLQGLAASRPAAAAKREDQEIRDALLAALDEAGLPMHLVNVIVSDGVVQLWGAVDSSVQHEAARAAVEGTSGVKRLEDHLGIVPTMVRVAHGGV